jgi:hypothetical protein
VRLTAPWVAGLAAGIAHVVATGIVWVMWDSVRGAGASPLPVVWRVLAFPVLALEDWQTRGTGWVVGRVDLFFWSWLANSGIWGLSCWAIVRWFQGRRGW